MNKLRRAWLKVNFEKSYWNDETNKNDADDEELFSKIRNEELDFYLRNDLNSIGSRKYFDKQHELIECSSSNLTRPPISNVEFMRRFYLALYNLVQLYGSIYLLTSLLLRYREESKLIEKANC